MSSPEGWSTATRRLAGQTGGSCDLSRLPPRGARFLSSDALKLLLAAVLVLSLWPVPCRGLDPGAVVFKPIPDLPNLRDTVVLAPFPDMVFKTIPDISALSVKDSFAAIAVANQEPYRPYPEMPPIILSPPLKPLEIVPFLPFKPLDPFLPTRRQRP